MAKARQNPLGKFVPGAALVKVGNGDMVHLYNPRGDVHLCESGKNAGVKGGSGAVPVLRDATGSKYVNCTRCLKLGELNIEAGRDAWDPGH